MPTNYGLYDNQGFVHGSANVCYSLHLLDIVTRTIVHTVLFNAPDDLASTLQPLEFDGDAPANYDDSYMMTTEQVTGFDCPAIADSFAPDTAGHGSSSGRLWRAGRGYTLEFMITPASDNAAESTARNDSIYELMQTLNVAGIEDQYQLVLSQTTLDTQGASDTHYFSKVKLVDCKISGGVPKYVMLQLNSDDPRIHALTGATALTDFIDGVKQEEVVFTIDGSGSGGGLVFPLAFPLVFGASGAGLAEENVTINGYGLQPIDLILTGEMVNPKIYNQLTGKHLDINYSIPAGETLEVVNSGGNDPTVTLNGTGNLYYTAAGAGSEFFGILPNRTNTLAIIADSYDVATAGLTVKYNPVYW